MIKSTPALIGALASIPVLTGIGQGALDLLAREGLVRDFGPCSWIVREGDEGHSFFILVMGQVEVVKHAETPHAVALATLRDGDFFGEMCVVEPMPRAASIRALTAVRAIEIRAATLHHLFKQEPGQYAIVLLNVARDMARRLRKIDEAYAGRAF